MSFDLTLSGSALEAAERLVPELVRDLVASGIAAQDPSLWGADAESEAAIRLGWTEAVALSEPLVPEIMALHEQLRRSGVSHFVLSGMGGSSLAPEVITRTAGVELTILDTTSPGQIEAALRDRLLTTALIVSSKSGSTVETDSHKRVYEQAFREAGIDPKERIIVVTDPGSPLDTSARADGYRVFNADPNVGGRYSALTAFGLVPSGLAGVDIAALLDEASSVTGRVSVDLPENPALQLGAAIAGSKPLRDKLGLVADGTYILGFADWAEQLIAESTGKLGKGLLPVVLDPQSPEIGAGLDDLQIVRFVESERATERVEPGEIEISGTLGAQFVVWETAIAVAGRILGINPFDQPDVESAKAAARGLLESTPKPTEPDFVDSGIEIRSSNRAMAASGILEATLASLFKSIPPNGYLSIQAYLDRLHLGDAAALRDLVAKFLRDGGTPRPVTFGWGPRFLHSTGQFHKGGPAVGVFLQLTSNEPEDLAIPGRPFSFGQLIRAQAQGDAAVLQKHGRPVLSLNLTDPVANLSAIAKFFG
ncbi:MAG: glucose-6-phosphate isomerase [Cryobacterium sp.]|nr:glucose-6-phosphate isomerase [Cryobacterium sp.]MCO5293974.1 glucose-6-phosphate isomerase [Homoserinimonas sp.]MCW5945330.1 glucose-6-phosphate isomerase [Cryobacterium sp.]